MTSTIQLMIKESVEDGKGKRLRQTTKEKFGIDIGLVQRGRLFRIMQNIDKDLLGNFARKVLQDPIIHELYCDSIYKDPFFASSILCAKHSGVTDDEGLSAQRALEDFMQKKDLSPQQKVFSQDLYFFEKRIFN